jgi:hypothetical protein
LKILFTFSISFLFTSMWSMVIMFSFAIFPYLQGFFVLYHTELRASLLLPHLCGAINKAISLPTCSV